jgi:hypothetical protein
MLVSSLNNFNFPESLIFGISQIGHEANSFNEGLVIVSLKTL